MKDTFFETQDQKEDSAEGILNPFFTLIFEVYFRMILSSLYHFCLPLQSQRFLLSPQAPLPPPPSASLPHPPPSPMPLVKSGPALLQRPAPIERIKRTRPRTRPVNPSSYRILRWRLRNKRQTKTRSTVNHGVAGHLEAPVTRTTWTVQTATVKAAMAVKARTWPTSHLHPPRSLPRLLQGPASLYL